MYIVLKSICMSYCKVFKFKTQNIQIIITDNKIIHVYPKSICPFE